jgi:hypothetical protein
MRNNKLLAYQDGDWSGLDGLRRRWSEEDGSGWGGVKIKTNILRGWPEMEKVEILETSELVYTNIIFMPLIIRVSIKETGTSSPMRFQSRALLLHHISDQALLESASQYKLAWPTSSSLTCAAATSFSSLLLSYKVCLPFSQLLQGYQPSPSRTNYYPTYDPKSERFRLLTTMVRHHE